MKWLILIVFSVHRIPANPRLCEVDGSCRACGDGRYSFYRCGSQQECYSGEVCDGEFCCPTPASNRNVATQNEWMMPSFMCASTQTWVPCASACEASCQEPNTLPCPTPNCQPGCQCLPGFVRATNSPYAQCIPYTLCLQIGPPQPPVQQQCKDPKRRYTTCGSSCPISCDTRLSPRCQDNCVQGCFCQVPYILEDGKDPLNSRCILPAECPQITQQTTPHPTVTASFPVQPFGNFGRTLPGIPVPAFERITQPTLPPLPSFPTLPPPPQFPFPTTTPSPVNPGFSRCADPLKEYLQCGSACPMGCDSPAFSANCLQQCVPGCYCRPPYVLLVSTVRESSCILPTQCPIQGSQDSVSSQLPFSTEKPPILQSLPKMACTDPRKEYSECGAERCARSCRNASGGCMPGTCFGGCVCREPYVLSDLDDKNSRCVLPTECESSCSDPKKEYVNCGSACPLGCDNRNPRHCTPCEKGCFCKNGFVFKNSTNWRESECIALEECPSDAAQGTAFISESATSSPTSTKTTSEPLSLQPPTTTTTAPPETTTLSPRCPSITQDIGGKACALDSECPNGQFCCRATIASLNASPQRCTCEDANAVYTSCGSLCPEYCGQPSKPVCSSTCNPACECAPGYVRIRNEVNAPCVKREFCPSVTASSIDAPQDGPIATMRDITPTSAEKENRFTPNLKNVATATLVSPHSFVSGKFTFERVTDSATRVRGTLSMLPPGSHAVVMHQFGDVTDGCSRLGPVFFGSKSQISGLLGDMTKTDSSPTEFIRIVDWPVHEIVGRGIAIYLQSTTEWALRSQEVRPIACGMIGVTRK